MVKITVWNHNEIFEGARKGRLFRIQVETGCARVCVWGMGVIVEQQDIKVHGILKYDCWTNFLPRSMMFIPELINYSLFMNIQMKKSVLKIFQEFVHFFTTLTMTFFVWVTCYM